MDGITILAQEKAGVHIIIDNSSEVILRNHQINRNEFVFKNTMRLSFDLDVEKLYDRCVTGQSINVLNYLIDELFPSYNTNRIKLVEQILELFLLKIHILNIQNLIKQ